MAESSIARNDVVVFVSLQSIEGAVLMQVLLLVSIAFVGFDNVGVARVVSGVGLYATARES